MANRPCKVLAKAMWVNAYDTASLINWWNTFLWINKNAVDKLRIRWVWDFLSPHEWLWMVLDSAWKYNKHMNPNPIVDLRKELLSGIKEIADPIIRKIINWEDVDLSKYKKKAQWLWSDIKYVESEISNWNVWKIKNDIINAGVYYISKTAEAFKSSYNDMEKTISQYNSLLEEWIVPYKHYISSEAKNIILWAFSNMAWMLDSPNDLEKFIVHSVKQDFLRFLERFNHKPLKWISWFVDSKWNVYKDLLDESRKKFYSIFYPTWADESKFVSDIEYSNLIQTMNWNYVPWMIIAGTIPSSILEKIYHTSADARRFASTWLNPALWTSLLVGSAVWYTVKGVSDYQQWLYKLEWMIPVFDALWIELDNIRWMMTRADMNDIVSAWRWSWDLSYINRLADVVKLKWPKRLEKLWISKFAATWISEWAWESLKWLHNIADAAAKYQIHASAMMQALRYFQFPDEKSFLQYFNSAQNKEWLKQAIIEKMEDYIQFAYWFYASPSWNINTLQRNKYVQPLQYLSSRGASLSKNIIDAAWFKILWHAIDWMTKWITWVTDWAWVWLDWKKQISDYMLLDPKFTSIHKLFQNTLLLWHSAYMTISEKETKDKDTWEPRDKTPLEIALESRWKFWRRANNYMQAIESNREWRLVLSMAEWYNNPFIDDNKKVASMVAWAWSSLTRDFLSKLKWSAILSDMVVAWTKWVLSDNPDVWIWHEVNKAWDRWIKWFNRYFVDQVDWSLTSKNVPVTKRDWLSMLFWKHINSISEMKSEIRNAAQIESATSSVWWALRFIKNQFLYNNAIWKAMLSFTEEYLNDSEKEEWFKWLIWEFESQWLWDMVDKWIIPLGYEVSDNPEEQKKWNQFVADTLYQMWSHWGRHTQTLSEVFTKPWIRDTVSYSSDYNYSDLKQIADKYIISQMSDEDFNWLMTLYNRWDKWDAKRLAELQVLTYINANYPWWWVVALSNMATQFWNEFEKRYKWSDVVDKRNEAVAAIFWPMIQHVSLIDYTNIMSEFVEKNEWFKKVKYLFDNNKKFNSAIKNTYKAWLGANSAWLWWKDDEDIFNWTDIMWRIYDIPDDDDALSDWKLNTAIMVSDELNANPHLSQDTRDAMIAKVLYTVRWRINYAMDNPEWHKKNEDLVYKLLDYYYSTYDQLQSAMDFQAIHDWLSQQ